MKISNGIALASLTALASTAMAEVDLSYTGLGPTSGAKWSYDGSVNWDGPSRTGSFGYLGVIEFNGGDIEGYCYDLDAPVSADAQSFNVLSWTDLNSEDQLRASLLADLYNDWYFDVLVTGDNDMATALAFLTNEIMEENFDLIPGTFYLTDIQAQSSNATGAVQFSDFEAGVQAFYDIMLAELDFGTNSMLDGLVFYESTDGEWQDIVSYVPAPSALALLGVAGLAGRRRRNG
jgi:hypothetical protein